MTIPNLFLEKWKLLRCQGDVKQLAKDFETSEVTITKALNKGKSSLELFEKLKTFYQEREKQITA